MNTKSIAVHGWCMPRAASSSSVLLGPLAALWSCALSVSETWCCSNEWWHTSPAVTAMLAGQPCLQSILPEATTTWNNENGHWGFLPLFGSISPTKAITRSYRIQWTIRHLLEMSLDLTRPPASWNIMVISPHGILSIEVRILDIPTKPTPVSSLSSLPSNESNSIFLATVLLKLPYLAMTFIPQMMHKANSVHQLSNK